MRGIERRVLVGHDGDGLAAEILDLLDAAVGAGNELDQRAAADQTDRAHRNSVWPDQDGRVADSAADRRIADADLLGHVDATLGALKGNVEPLGGVVALVFGELPGRERRKESRRRQ